MALLAANGGAAPEVTIRSTFKTNQVRRKFRHPLTFLLCKSVLDRNILSLNPSKLAQLLPERINEDHATRSSAIIQETYAEYSSWLLRLGEMDESQNKRSEERSNNIYPWGSAQSKSFDHFIRSRQHVGRNRQTDLLRGFQIDDELELCRLLDW